jgi:hypothetical protein
MREDKNYFARDLILILHTYLAVLIIAVASVLVF